jgi:hypothetical protein
VSKSSEVAAERDNRKKGEYHLKHSLTKKGVKAGHEVQPDLGQDSSLKLMPFQVRTALLDG